MKIKELITELQKYLPDMTVCVDGYESGFNNINSISVVKVALDVFKKGHYEGQHQGVKSLSLKYDTDILKKNKQKEILVLGRHKT